MPYTFVLMNWAAVVSLYYFLTANRDGLKEIWISSTTPLPAMPEMPPSAGAAYDDRLAA